MCGQADIASPALTFPWSLFCWPLVDPSPLQQQLLPSVIRLVIFLPKWFTFARTLAAVHCTYSFTVKPALLWTQSSINFAAYLRVRCFPHHLYRWCPWKDAKRSIIPYDLSAPSAFLMPIDWDSVMQYTPMCLFCSFHSALIASFALDSGLNL